MSFKILAAKAKEESIFFLICFLTLTGIAFLAPMIGRQEITGPIINAVLFISTFLLGIRAAVFIAVMPSLIAFSFFLSPVFAPIIPFIMIGNIILIISFSYFKDKNFWLGIVVASFLKFAFLFFSSFSVASVMLKGEMAQKIVTIMSWPQLFTALLGGVISYVFLKYTKFLEN